MKQLVKKIKINTSITLITGLHIGGNSENVEIGGIDNPVIKLASKGDVPYIPGSSLKGKMRCLLEQAAGAPKVGLDEKVNKLKNGEFELGAFSEFGMRRRLSAEAQDLAVKTLSDNKYPSSTFVGTSNVYLAKKYGIMTAPTLVIVDGENAQKYVNASNIKKYVDDKMTVNA